MSLNIEWSQWIKTLFVRHEFIAKLVERNFFTTYGIIELISAIAWLMLLMWICNKITDQKNSQNTTKQSLIRYWRNRLTFPFLLWVSSFILMILWNKITGERSIWLWLMMIASPWMMIIRTLSVFLHYLLPQFFTAWLDRAFSGTIWLIFVLWISGLSDMLQEWAKSMEFSAGQGKISLYSVISGIFWIAVALILALWISRLLESRLQKAEKMDASLRIVISKIVTTLLVILAVLITLPLVGINLTMLSVFGGALGVGLGFGLQKIASNYVSGFIILLDRSIRPGDRLNVGGFTGYVNKITSRYVVLKNTSGSEALVPNETFIANTVISESYSSKLIWRSITVQVAYSTDLPHAMNVLRNIGATHPGVDQTSPPKAYVTEFADSGINLVLGFWLKAEIGSSTMTLESELLLEIWKQFKQLGIEFPYPQREVRILNDSLPH